MGTEKDNLAWDDLSYSEKNFQLYLNQKELLDIFLEKGAISKKQYEKSLHDLSEKTGHHPEEHTVTED